MNETQQDQYLQAQKLIAEEKWQPWKKRRAMFLWF